MVHARQVQHAVDDRLEQILGVLGADDDVAELARGRAGAPSSSTGNDSTSVGPSLPRCSALSSAIRSASTNSTATWPSSIPAEAAAIARPPPRTRLRGQRVADHVDLEHDSGRAAALVAPGRSSARLRCGVLVVGLDDPLHELVAHDVLAAEAHELDALDALEDVADHDQARTSGRAGGRPA